MVFFFPQNKELISIDLKVETVCYPRESRNYRLEPLLLRAFSPGTRRNQQRALLPEGKLALALAELGRGTRGMKIHLYSKDPLPPELGCSSAPAPLRNAVSVGARGCAGWVLLVCQAAVSRAFPKLTTGEVQEHHFTGIHSGGHSTTLQTGNPMSRYDIAAETSSEPFIIKAQNCFFKFLWL